jgi:hypothetical protein
MDFVALGYMHIGYIIGRFANSFFIMIPLFFVAHFLYVFGMIYFPIAGLIINSFFIVDLIITYVKLNTIDSSESSARSSLGSNNFFISLVLTIPFSFFIIIEIILLFIVLSGSGKKAEIKDYY